MKPHPTTWQFWVLLSLAVGFGSVLAVTVHAVRVMNAIINNVILTETVAQTASSIGTFDKTFLFPVDADGPYPLGRIFTTGTLVEIGCIVHAEVTNGIATGTDANTLSDTSHVDNDGATVDFTTLGLDTDGSDLIWNLTDDATCGITGVTDANTLECSGNLSGGHTFANNDSYSIQQNDVTVRVQLYQTTSAGRWTWVQLGDTVDCVLGETRDTAIAGATALTSDRTVLVNLEVIGTENPEWVQVWAKVQ